MKKLVPLSDGEIVIHHSDDVVFMCLGHASPDVDLVSHSSLRPFIFNKHCRWNEGLWMHREVCHGCRRKRMRESRSWERGREEAQSTLERKRGGGGFLGGTEGLIVSFCLRLGTDSPVSSTPVSSSSMVCGVTSACGSRAAVAGVMIAFLAFHNVSRLARLLKHDDFL
jgi:hypothetical protein